MADVYTTILKWSEKKLPLWQRDALRRIVTQPKLGRSDDAELVAMVKVEAGIPVVDAPTPLPLAAEHVSQSQSATEAVTLLAIHDVKNVNALAPGQKLTFAERGLTVTYGENGTGKTGYSRILRKACRARRPIDILPDVATRAAGLTEAVFTVRKSFPSSCEVRWSADKAPPDELATFSVFDRECERDFVDDDGELAFVPSGLAAFEELAEATARVKQALVDEEIRVRPRDGLDDVRREVRGPAEAVKFLADIRPGEPTAHYEALAATLASLCGTKEDSAALERVNQKLAELQVNDPAKQAADLRTLAQRLETARQSWASASDALGDDALLLLKTARDAKRTADEARRTLATVADQVGVPGFGSETWRALYLAAASYAAEHVHPGIDFPSTADGAVCPLCHQVLAADAKARFERFRTYMTSAAERVAREAATKLAAAQEPILEVTGTRIDDLLVQRIAEICSEAVIAVGEIVLSIAARRDAIAAALESGAWEDIPGVPQALLETVAAAVAAIRAKADSVEKLADPAVRSALEAERARLLGKLEMAKNKDRIAVVLAALSDAARLAACHAKINTKAITVKGKETADSALSKGLLDAFTDEMKTLGALDRLNVTVGHRGTRGRTVYGLALTGASGGPWKRSDVLSEGEQRVVAFAYFLAEARQAPTPVGIIIDDPVCSLDHRWCRAIAQRLAALAVDRQVIIFTHNIWFYCELEGLAAEGQIPFHPQFLMRRNGKTGVCDAAGSPWEKLDLGSRMKPLTDEIQVLKALHASDPDGRPYRTGVGEAVDHLRAAWERAVEEIVLNKVVERFGADVQTRRLTGVACDDATFKAVNDAMTRLSELTKAHDKAAQHLGTPPDARALDTELRALEKFIGEQRKKRKAATDSRESLAAPPAAQVAS